MALTLDGLALPNANHQQARAVPKGPTRLEVKTAAKKLALVDEKTFKAEVWSRDHAKCRCCHRKVAKVSTLIPERGDVHHIHGRTGDLRFESKAALLLCLKCHQRVTGKVNDRLVIVPTKTFETRQGVFTDARSPVHFKKVA